ncbi:MAG: hypothetical protein K2P84_05220, partial [Undibacterium sp.]|nr:hypothetical protein [Undibacterium sp.]
HLGEVLPDYMIPAAFVLLDELPLTGNGKVDLKALPQPDLGSRRGNYSPAQSWMEKQLTLVWGDVLKLTQIGIHDNFFSLGGNSLTAVRLVSAIEKQCGVRLPMAQLFNTPSIAALAASVNAKGGVKRLAVLMQHKGNLSPLFLIHPGGGGIFCYSGLVGMLGEDRPIYGIQDADEAGLMITPYDLNTIAARYVEEMILIQPEGPYTLAGWSLGGMLAFRMANILEQQGMQVRWVMLLDSAYPRITQFQNMTLENFIVDLLDGSEEDLAMRYDSERLALVEKVRVLVAEIGIKHFVSMLQNESNTLELELNFEKSIQSLLLQKYHSMNQNGRLLMDYSVAPLSAPVHCVWAEQTVKLGRDLTCWDAFIVNQQDASHHIVPGDHDRLLLGESMVQIAQIIRRYLDNSSIDESGDHVRTIVSSN